MCMNARSFRPNEIIFYWCFSAVCIYFNFFLTLFLSVPLASLSLQLQSMRVTLWTLPFTPIQHIYMWLWLLLIQFDNSLIWMNTMCVWCQGAYHCLEWSQRLLASKWLWNDRMARCTCCVYCWAMQRVAIRVLYREMDQMDPNLDPNPTRLFQRISVIYNRQISEIQLDQTSPQTNLSTHGSSGSHLFESSKASLPPQSLLGSSFVTRAQLLWRNRSDPEVYPEDPLVERSVSGTRSIQMDPRYLRL